MAGNLALAGAGGGAVVVESNLYIDGYVAAESVSRQVVG